MKNVIEVYTKLSDDAKSAVMVFTVASLFLLGMLVLGLVYAPKFVVVLFGLVLLFLLAFTVWTYVVAEIERRDKEERNAK